MPNQSEYPLYGSQDNHGHVTHQELELQYYV